MSERRTASAVSIAFVFVAFALGILMAAPAAQAIEFSRPFISETGDTPSTVAVGEFNGDSDPDLAVANTDGGSVSILLGAAGRTLTGPTNFGAGATPTGLAVGNFNGDAHQDLAVTNRTSSTVSVLLGAGGGSFGAPTSFPVGTEPVAVAVGDFDKDSDPDLAVANQYSYDVSILLGRAGGDFDTANTLPSNFNSLPSALAIGDFNGDSDLDLAIAHYNSSLVGVRLGGAEASFGAQMDFEAGLRHTAIAAGDFNGDSDPELVVTNHLHDTISILVGASGGSFGGPLTHATGGDLPVSIAVGDFNGDSDPDLAVANDASSESISVFIGADGLAFHPAAHFPSGAFSVGYMGFPQSVAVADFDGASGPDIATANLASPSSEPDELGLLLQLRFDGYARPRAATPVTVKLVPAFNECSSANAEHGAPLTGAACSPPAQSSSFLTFAADDRSPPFNATSNGSGTLRLKVFCTDGGPTPCGPSIVEEADVQIDAAITGVRCVLVGGGCTVPGGTYSGKLLLKLTARMTDDYNGSTLIEPGTVSDATIEIGMQCTAGDCSTSTTVNSAIFAAAREGQRAVWGLSAIEVYDGGPDGDLVESGPPTTGPCPPACSGNGGETLFLEQGLFLP